MSLYDKLGGGRPQQQQTPQQTPQQIISQIKQDPRGMLAQANLDIPEGMRDASEVLNHILTSGQLKEGVRQQALRMLGLR